MRPLLTLGMYSGGCLMLLGLLSACTIILIPVGVHLIWLGFLVTAAFWAARELFRGELRGASQRAPDAPGVRVRRDEEREHDPVERQVADELGESEHNERHRKQREADRHHRTSDLT